MATQTMTEKDHYVAAFEKEFETTMRLLRDYPPGKLDLKPAEKLKSARDVIWMLVMNQHILQPLMANDRLEPQPPPPPPANLDAILGAFQAAHQDTLGKLKALDPSAFNAMVTIPVGPKQLGEVRRGDAMWMFLYDTIHHRGQVSVYQRIAGGKVRSIYGPTADEPWW